MSIQKRLRCWTQAAGKCQIQKKIVIKLLTGWDKKEPDAHALDLVLPNLHGQDPAPRQAAAQAPPPGSLVSSSCPPLSLGGCAWGGARGHACTSATASKEAWAMSSWRIWAWGRAASGGVPRPCAAAGEERERRKGAAAAAGDGKKWERMRVRVRGDPILYFLGAW